MSQYEQQLPPRRLSVAPMLDWTDRHFRRFFREISRHTWLYSEMVTTGAVLFGDAARHLRFDAKESPLALQLGGSEPDELARCAKLAEHWGYDEVNLNVGCPSDRVQRGAFGACLMREPQRVAECLKAMQDATELPVTVKHRIGVDDDDSLQKLTDFVGELSHIGCRVFIVHARNAILQGLSPKENREIPPLKYERVYALKRAFPELEIVINGGIRTWAEVDMHLQYVDGVMIGREAYHNPWLFHDADRRYFGADENPCTNRAEVLRHLLPYVTAHCAEGGSVRDVARHVLGLMHGVAGGRKFRQILSDARVLREAGAEIFLRALDAVEAS